MSRPRPARAEQPVMRSPTREYQTDTASNLDTPTTRETSRPGRKRCPRRRPWAPLPPAPLTEQPPYQWFGSLVVRGSEVLPGGGIAQVESAGEVEGVLAGPDGQPGREDRFGVVVVAGPVDRDLPVMGRADVTQPAQRLDPCLGGGLDVGEHPAVAHP